MDTYLEDNVYICGVISSSAHCSVPFYSLLVSFFAIMDSEEEVLPGQLCFNELKVLK